MSKARVIGTGSYVPPKIVDNDDLSNIVDTNDEWIKTRTGIQTRRISEGEDTSQVALKAAEKALDNAGVRAEELDLIIVATITPDYFTPSVACLIQAHLGASRATAFDISAACTGFVYGLTVAQQFIENSGAKKVLVIGAEVLSKVMNWEDRNTCVLFGDGAGAAVLEAVESGGILTSYMGSEGDIKGSLNIPAVTVKNPYTEKKQPLESYIAMNGKDIFKFATKIIKKSINQALKKTDYSLEEIAYIVPHQANTRIIDYVAVKGDIPKEKFYMNLQHVGNTSSASIPIALDEMNKKNLLKPKDKIILVGFGGGLTWGSILLEW